MLGKDCSLKICSVFSRYLRNHRSLSKLSFIKFPENKDLPGDCVQGAGMLCEGEDFWIYNSSSKMIYRKKTHRTEKRLKSNIPHGIDLTNIWKEASIHITILVVNIFKSWRTLKKQRNSG
ncbi:uncharacterized protein LOC143188067 [Calliopsis andreniformis]|uniref:uncharacterized protein LOC143188067 n=1 Tax=Calliopsis andreniformis TaxID=337506 RepID=UPI003FCCCCCA